MPNSSVIRVLILGDFSPPRACASGGRLWNRRSGFQLLRGGDFSGMPRQILPERLRRVGRCNLELAVQSAVGRQRIADLKSGLPADDIAGEDGAIRARKPHAV